MATILKQQRVSAKWVTYREVPLWCCDFGGLGSDRDRLMTEIAAAQVEIDRRPENSFRLSAILVSLGQTHRLAETIALLQRLGESQSLASQ